MTQQVNLEQTEPSGRRSRGRTRPYPSVTFEEALTLPKSIIEHGVQGEISRVTLLAKINRSPTSSKTRDLIISSGKYGLTSGTYNAPSLRVTVEGRLICNSKSSSPEVKGKQFQLSIAQFQVFNSIYEKLKGERLPDLTVLSDEFKNVGVAGTESRRVAEIFTANIRYLSLIQQITGNEFVRAIEQVPLDDSDHIFSEQEEDTIEPARPIVSSQEIPSVERPLGQPSVHLDIQIHVDSSATAEQMTKSSLAWLGTYTDVKGSEVWLIPDRHYNLLQAAQNIQQDADSTGLGRLRLELQTDIAVERSLLDHFDDRVTNSSIRNSSRKLFVDSHYARAVEAAFKALNNTVKNKSGLSDSDGDSLMRKAFSANNPVLRLNQLRTVSERDEQRGYMELYAGAMTAIRNPRAHEHNLEDDPQRALELLTLANHLMGKLEAAKKTRTRRSTY